MKTLRLLAAAATSAVALGAGVVGAYPPGVTSLTLNPSTVTPGATFVATFNGCEDSETVTFELNGTTVTATCAGPAAFRRPAQLALGSASATLTAPTALGAYTVTATGLTSGNFATATLTVVAATAGGGGALPTTGSDSAPTTQIAIGLVAVGAGLAAVGGYRHRKRSAAA